MTINEHVPEFAGLPCLDFAEDMPLPADAASVAWRLRVDHGTPAEDFVDPGEAFLPRVDPALTAYPGPRVLRVRGADGLGFHPVWHEHLRESAFESGGLPAEVVQAVGRSELPVPARSATPPPGSAWR